MSRPRIRTIKPEAPQDERIGRLSRDARLLFFTGIVTMADDEGRLRAMPTLIIGHTFPYDDDVTTAKLRRWLDEIEREGLIVRYEHDGTPYVAIRHWRRHQRPNRPVRSVIPDPPDPDVVRANALPTHGELTDESVSEHGDSTDDASPRAQARGSRSSSLPDPSLQSEDDARAQSRQRIFDAWIEVTDRTDRTVLDPKRRKLLDKALETYPEQDVLDAVKGWRHSPHHCGHNDTGTVYNDLGLLLRDNANIERFRDLERRPPTPIRRPAAGGGWTAEDMIAIGKESA